MREPHAEPSDPVVAAYRAGIDETLIVENLRLTVEERFRKWMELQRFAEELRRAAEGARR
ncbi:MAG TPA: hypothetical protein VFL83_12235 [Anaeromyxobacter sp.]|nr:hypothetical protein [Anaeromyxobacter sp.]